jgi:hypothetical protein
MWRKPQRRCGEKHLALPRAQTSSGWGRGSARLGERMPPLCGYSEGDTRATETLGESPVVSFARLMTIGRYPIYLFCFFLALARNLNLDSTGPGIRPNSA